MTREPFDELFEHLPTRELDSHEVDELVSSVTSGVARTRRRRFRRRLALAVAAAAVVVALVMAAFWSASRPEDRIEVSPVAAIPEQAGEPLDEPDVDDDIRAEAGSRFEVLGPPEDRVVWLEAGQVRCDVHPRREGGRFRVLVGDDEIEVTGTRFVVTADDEHLEAVSVEEGEVVLRLRDGRTRRLVGGESWTRPRRDPEPAVVERPDEDEDDGVGSEDSHASGEAFRTGLARYDAQDWAAARRHFEEVQEGPLRSDARFWAAMSRVRLAPDEGAVEVLEQALQAGVPAERVGAVHCVLGLLLTDLGRADTAEHHLARAAEDADPTVRACGAPGP